MGRTSKIRMRELGVKISGRKTSDGGKGSRKAR
jgi:hypothetical protein